MPSLVVAFHSGYGHTLRLVEAAVQGAASVSGVQAQALDVSRIDESGWARLEPDLHGGPIGRLQAVC